MTGIKYRNGPVIVKEAPSAATGTYAAGEVVGLTSGACVIGANGNCAGVSLQAAVTGGTTKFLVITPENEWIMSYASTTAATQVGVDYLLTYTTGSQVVSATTTTPTVTVQELDKRDAVGASGGRLIVRFNQANCVMTGLVTAAS